MPQVLCKEPRGRINNGKHDAHGGAEYAEKNPVMVLNWLCRSYVLKFTIEFKLLLKTNSCITSNTAYF